jgi:transcriptional regulator with XRE-family HTH domain
MLWGVKRTLAAIQRDIAANLRRARSTAGLSQEALAFAADVDRTYVSQIERGIGNPSIAILVRLANCMAKDAADLLQTPDGRKESALKPAPRRPRSWKKIG